MRQTRCAMIIPLGPESLRDSSSLPEGRSNPLLRANCIRAGPALPSYLALLHAGFSVPRMLPSGRWALTPPFHPYQMMPTETGGPVVSRWPAAEVFASPAVSFSVALSVAAPSFYNEGATPWRYQARRPAAADSCELTAAGVRTFLPSTSLARSEPAIIRLTRWFYYTA